MSRPLSPSPRAITPAATDVSKLATIIHRLDD